MQMKHRLTVNGRDVELWRKHSKLGEIITWDVIVDKHTRVAVIREVNDYYLIKKFSWRQFPTKYWIASVFWGHAIEIAMTRKDLLNKIIRPIK